VRGRLVSMNQLMITTGILVAYLVDYALSSTKSWQAMLGIGIAPAVLLGVGMVFLPQSPRWLMEMGRTDEAREVLGRLGQEEDLEQELAEAPTDTSPSRDWRRLLAANLRRVLVIGIGLAVLQQVTGINTVIYYSPTILKSTGLGSSNSILSAVPVAIINLLMTVLSLAIIDRVGRRPLLLTSLAGMVVSIAGLGVTFSVHAASWLSVVCLAFFAIGMGPVFWLLISEIYPQRVRGEAMSVATAFNWLANFVVALSFPLLIASIGGAGTFWIFAGLGIAAIAFSVVLVPETTGRSLEDIEHELVGAPAAT
jgi:sugar porter (SP) family MFS transporter